MLTCNEFYNKYIAKGILIPLKTGKQIVKAEQTKPDSRAAGRQVQRESDRKWEVTYRREVKK